jgi:lipopolysaccharide/colanic/teichoic acid biosynthesis glycosyltransferase
MDGSPTGRPLSGQRTNGGGDVIVGVGNAVGTTVAVGLAVGEELDGEIDGDEHPTRMTRTIRPVAGRSDICSMLSHWADPYTGRVMDQTSERVLDGLSMGLRPPYAQVKRGTDVVLAGVLLLALAPVMMVVGLFIVLDSGFPVFYRCQRLGRRGRILTMLKFRTMRDGSHHHLTDLLANDEELRLEYERQRKLRGDPRRTRVGAILRRTSLDELPQLWNILVGDMTLVGPRPYFLHELDDRPEREVLLSVRPGLTGLWQISGRSDLTFEERVALEMDYVARAGPGLDWQILARTAGAVISGRGAY